MVFHIKCFEGNIKFKARPLKYLIKITHKKKGKHVPAAYAAHCHIFLSDSNHEQSRQSTHSSKGYSLSFIHFYNPSQISFKNLHAITALLPVTETNKMQNFKGRAGSSETIRLRVLM